jgi:hypothetical protein
MGTLSAKVQGAKNIVGELYLRLNVHTFNGRRTLFDLEPERTRTFGSEAILHSDDQGSVVLVGPGLKCRLDIEDPDPQRIACLRGDHSPGFDDHPW